MGWASKSGRARTSSQNPQAFAVCDRCGMWYNHVNLSWQFEWRGAALQNIRILVCNRCLDVPQQQLRSIVLPPDPVAIENPRQQNFGVEIPVLYTSKPTVIDPVTGIPKPQGQPLGNQDGSLCALQQTGEPPGGLNQRPGTDPNAPGNNKPGLPRGNIVVPETGDLT